MIDLVAAVFACVLLLVVLVFVVKEARIQARAAGCRENLRKIGIAMAAYTEAYGTFPVVQLAGPPFQLAHSPQALLLAYLPDANVPYDPRRPWFLQNEGVGAAVIPTFRCPASAHENPVDSPAARRLKRPTGTLLGTTDYIVSKGPNDSWCVRDGASAVPLKERGTFEIERPVRPDDIADGLAQTICMGEGTGGSQWTIAKAHRVPFSASDKETGKPVPALNFWGWPFINTRPQKQRGDVIEAGIFGSAATGINDRPVTETRAEIHKLDDCRSSSRDGVHTVSGFRSDHDAGCFFLFADGSSRMLGQDIDQRTFEALSTIAGSESAEFLH